ncbi:putative phage tail protein [Brevibacillus parabrevis]|uniref:putative phage tail protein n=1 Tax=Brevibacillus parabrevis TaxID=54914 RepID=UPI00265F5F40|nr:putative phage tail protein [Brevibacillus parabrevis]
MRDYMPRYYDDFPVVMNLVDREADVIIALNEAAAVTLAQAFVGSADRDLPRWERICGIKTDETKSLEVRRAIVKSRLQGAGTVTVAVVRELADTIYGAATEVREDFTGGRVVVTLVGKRGVAADAEDVRKELRELIPAHLGIALEFTWFVWNEFDALTWNEADAFTWDELEVYMP